MSKELTMQMVKIDIDRIEFRIRHVVKIDKLAWFNNSIVPILTVSKKNKDTPKEEWDDAVVFLERNLGGLFEKYMDQFPQQYESFKKYEQYHLKHKV